MNNKGVMLSDISEWLLSILIVSFFITLFIVCPIYKTMKYKTYYEYIDLDNNKGIAKKCNYSDRVIFSGGQGTPICELDNGTIIMVKQYKEITERK